MLFRDNPKVRVSVSINLQTVAKLANCQGMIHHQELQLAQQNANGYHFPSLIDWHFVVGNCGEGRDTRPFKSERDSDFQPNDGNYSPNRSATGDCR